MSSLNLASSWNTKLWDVCVRWHLFSLLHRTFWLYSDLTCSSGYIYLDSALQGQVLTFVLAPVSNTFITILYLCVELTWVDFLPLSSRVRLWPVESCWHMADGIRLKFPPIFSQKNLEYFHFIGTFQSPKDGHMACSTSSCIVPKLTLWIHLISFLPSLSPFLSYSRRQIQTGPTTLSSTILALSSQTHGFH